jgi:hypothetical protein
MDRRAITLPIHSFKLKNPIWYSNEVDQQVFNDIVDYVVQRGIQNFDLNTRGNYGCWIKLPVTIFSCRTLKTLKLTYIAMDNISDEVDLHLPSLKTLHLTKSVFDEVDHLIKLLLSCPILKDLKLTRFPKPCGIENRFGMKFIDLPNLIKARISCKSYIPLSMLCKAQILCLEKVV